MKNDFYWWIGWICLYPLRLVFHLVAAFIIPMLPETNRRYLDYVIKN